MLGPNGAGKTTLFGIMTGTMAPNSRTRAVRRADITRLSASDRCRLGMARSFQVPQPFGGMTVFENLVVAGGFRAKADARRDVYRSLRANARGMRARRQSQRQAGSLTLLDRKRLELARALATRPRVLLLDEVAGGLSEVECEVLVALINRIRASGVSIIWIEHSSMRCWRRSTASSCWREGFSSPTTSLRRRSPSQGRGNLHGHSGR